CANPPGRGILHSYTGTFTGFISRKERRYSVGWQGQSVVVFPRTGEGRGGAGVAPGGPPP
ncbi:MAG: hypothetical protein LBG25_04000, partial [Spirochaetaceae bacterium]|nr:hypothetical protein [Spirochaetaceae bacterium]